MRIANRSSGSRKIAYQNNIRKVFEKSQKSS
ncbi:hypothetical protein RUMTOR_02534 [[Ruminococcus] torques ATCC 27756]|uniref:Uncharacterized protein n=1 Tax=[Ruminococcus] torques ATCC 27756 TaxID=411460 RepID=A5KQJ6_9FIRM|nr:hypothetical protein RUMTOR_02534 [[Ruminococcus] torques ATCC 27756]